MNSLRHSIVSSALALTIIGTSAASTIAVNFAGGFDNETIAQSTGENTAALDSIMGFNTPVWTNLGKDGGGATTNVTDGTNGFTLTYHARNGWSAGSEGTVTTTTDVSQQAFRGYLDDGDDGNSYNATDGYGVSLQLSGLSSYLTSVGATSYNLTVLLSTDSSTGFRTGELRRGILSGGAISDLTFIQTLTSTRLGNGIAPFSDPVPAGADNDTGGSRGYLTLTGLTEDQLTLAFLTSDNGFRGSVAGFAITPVPEPAVSLLGCVGALAILRRRR